MEFSYNVSACEEKEDMTGKEKKKENKNDSINKDNRKEESSFLYQHCDTTDIFMKPDAYNFHTNHRLK